MTNEISEIFPGN